MLVDLVSKAAGSLPEIPFVSPRDVTDRVRNVIPAVPALPTTEDVSGAVRRAGERVLQSVDDNIIYGPTLTRGVVYCGDAASSLPFIGSSIRLFVPQRSSGECKVGEEAKVIPEESNKAKFNRSRERLRRQPQKDVGKTETEPQKTGWRIPQTPGNPLTSASSLLSALLPNLGTFSRLSSALTNAALQTSMSASAITFSASNAFFAEYSSYYTRALSKCRAVMYCREKTPFEATQYLLNFAINNVTKLCVCSPGELIRALAMFGALQKVLGKPYPPAQPVFNTKSQAGRVEFRTLQRLYDFALASYGPLILVILRMNLTCRSVDELIIRLTGVSQKDILLSNTISKFQQPAFALVMDHNFKRIVVTVRGTANVEDILTDVHAESTPFHVGHAHRGMLCSAQYLDRGLRKLVTENSKNNPNYEVIVTGHSLGGAIATVLAIMWHNDRVIGPKVRCISFAAAACVSMPLAEDCKGFVTSIIYADDLISRLSMKSVENLRHILVVMCSTEGREQCVDSNSISTLIEQYITAERSASGRWYNHLLAAYNMLTSSAASQISDHHLMFPGGKLRYVIPDGDYAQHPERKPSNHYSSLIPNNMHMLFGQSLQGLGEIVCNPEIFLRHFPTLLNDFFRPRDLSDDIKIETPDFEDMNNQFCTFNDDNLLENTSSDSDNEEKNSIEFISSRSTPMLTPRRKSFQNLFCIRKHSV